MIMPRSFDRVCVAFVVLPSQGKTDETALLLGICFKTNEKCLDKTYPGEMIRRDDGRKQCVMNPAELAAGKDDLEIRFGVWHVMCYLDISRHFS